MSTTTTETPAATATPVVLTTERKRLLHYIFTTALEGGIGYWSSCLKYHWALKGTDGEEDLDGFFADIEETENEDDDGNAPKHRIDAEVIDRGINRLARNEATFGGKPLNGDGRLYTLACALNGPLAEDVDYDAGDADNIVQAGLFNDIVYG